MSGQFFFREYQMRNDEQCMKRLRATIEELDNNPDHAMISWCLGELEEIEQYLLEKGLAK
jgi:hypothetical protein